MECLATYKCGDLQPPEEGEVLGPWVSIDFVSTEGGGEGSAITVGNDSSTSTDPKNCAVIKSMDLGYADGTMCKIVIHDTEGGSFEAFLNHLIADWGCLKTTPTNLLMKVTFGWVKSTCKSPSSESVSEPFYVLCDSVETNFSQGKFIFEITGTDVGHRVFEGGVQWQKGGEGQEGVYFLEAVKEFLCDSCPPNFGSVEFKILDGKTELGEGDPIFKSDDPMEQIKGPKNKWVASGRNKLEVVREWSRRCPSRNDRFWIPQCNTNDKSGKIIWWEDKRPNNGAESDGFWDATCVGTYIVNGGQDSRVIEFNPKIRWDFGVVTGSGGQIGDLQMNPLDNEGAQNPGLDNLPRKNNECAGNLQQITTSDGENDLWGAEATKEKAKNDNQEKKTINISMGSITADLVIIGDPKFCSPMDAINLKNIAIIFINPFHINSNGDACGEWLAKPICNEILSNKGWIIRSVNHRIEAGTYTTTINVELTAPGVHFDKNGPIGAWTGGWTPKGTC